MKFTSMHRLGSLLLIAVIGLLIAIIAALRACSPDTPAVAPSVAVGADAAATADSATIVKPKKPKSRRGKKSAAKPGRQPAKRAQSPLDYKL